MPEFLVALLNALSLMDTSAPKEGQSTWTQRHRKLINVLFILCMLPFCVVGLVFLIQWLSNLGPVAQKVAMGVGAIQLIGLLALLGRRRKA
ncbi:hypothetical protein FQ192_18485 [Pseudomonas sp. ANT_J12]|jgi:archaellum biogenesis protein FlaJ (TadC family)|uniref:hypothetical protein n=1 Tax=Pseudomonas sp. ANT_J12 TaxID=2597351 RepID=UPI0011F3F8A2|nr:hypothetical protein [Pseudomonas sp. ANT_J12]KAA0987950.1 hypothetical protein FQ192_18485 [Pseudomonas sp. ANT_J12]